MRKMKGNVAARQTIPVTLTVVASFLFLASLVAFVTGTSLLFPGPIWNWLWSLNRPALIAFQKLGSLPGILLLALGVGAGAAGVGLLKRKKWAWWFAIALFTTNGLGDMVTWLVTRDFMRAGSGFLIACIFVSCLNQPGVRRAIR
jgi:hypothetical protein